MFRYRMGAGISRLTLLLIAVALFICIIGFSQVFKQNTQPSSVPASTSNAITPTFEERLLLWWDEGKASMKRLWELLTRQQPDSSIDANSDLNSSDGSGEDDPEITDNSSDVKIEVLGSTKLLSFIPLGSTPQVLIYHTHTHEAYTKTPGEDYVEAAKWRTVNNQFNIVRVGEALATELSTKYGIGVVHDDTDTEVPVLGTAYERSLTVVQKNMDQYKDLKIIIDLHRDAYNTSINPNTVTINGVKAARVMFVIGTGEGKTGVGFASRPDWKINLALAQAVNDNLKKFDSQLSRDISIKTGRYNQHLSAGAILIEVGNNENTLEEALATVPFLAQAISDAFDHLSGTQQPSPPPSSTAAPTPSASPEATASASAVPVKTPEPIIIETIPATAPPSATPSVTPSATATPQSTKSPGATITPNWAPPY
jgi:stage II sporulation protein P